MKGLTVLIACFFYLAVAPTLGGYVDDAREPEMCPVIRSVSPMSGREGTVVTVTGSGFETRPDNNCVVVGGMGAMAMVLPGATPTKLRMRIGPVAMRSAGDVLLWVGAAATLHKGLARAGNVNLRFSHSHLFRNRSACPVAEAGVEFELIKASPGTYAGGFVRAPRSSCYLDGLEYGPVIQASFPRDLKCPNGATVDVEFLLKEPTLAIEFSAAILGKGKGKRVVSGVDCLRIIARAITENARYIGERVSACVAENAKTGELDLLVTKPYLESGAGSIRIASQKR